MTLTNAAVNNILSLRLEEYRKELRDFWLTLMLPMAIVSGGMIFGVFYWVHRIIGYGQVDWRIAAVLFTFGALILPYLMFKPTKPTRFSVAYDGMLNQIGVACREQR
jgi:hypothetical protein